MALEAKKRMFHGFILFSALLFGGFCVAPTVSYADRVITIDVAPNVLNIQSQGEVVTVHTNIAYGEVEPLSIILIVENNSGVAISSWKADDRGYFVAKFLVSLIKDLDLEINKYNTFTMEGSTKGGEGFSGSQEILVINNFPKKP